MRKLALVPLVAVVALVMSSAGAGISVPVEVSAGEGTRTMAVKSAGGGSLSSLDLGDAGSAPLMVDVDDDRYSHVGYQVSMTLSDFYGYAGGSYACGKKLPASSFSIGYVPNPVAVADIAARAGATFDLAGALTGSLADVLGVASGTELSVSDLSADAVQSALAGILTGAEATLPVKASAGETASFTSGAPHPDCGSGGGSPTSVTVAKGSRNSASALLSWVTSAVTSTADADGNGTVTATELVSTGLVADGAMTTAVRSALAAAGVDLTTLNALIAAGTVSMADIYAALVATMDALTGLAGQSGSYVVVPKLSVSVPSGTPAADYRGVATLTIVDV